jgi:polysaccharide export outer membrane protein
LNRKYTDWWVVVIGLALLPPVLYGAETPPTANQALGVGDQIIVQALHVPDITSTPIRIDTQGFITLPLAGRIRAAGLSVEDLQKSIAGRLAEFIVEPEVFVNVVEFRSQPVSVVGSVNTPGVYQLQGNKTLAEILALAGGPKPDAADRVRITRREPCSGQALPDSRNDLAANTVVGEVSLSALFEGRNSAGSLAICPGDVITLPRAHLIYVMGEVHKPGGFPLRDQESASVLQAVSLSEGLLNTANSAHALILRTRPEGGKREEINVNLKAILDGKAADVNLNPEDVLLIPNSVAKNALARTAEAMIQIGTGVVIWGKY